MYKRKTDRNPDISRRRRTLLNTSDHYYDPNAVDEQVGAYRLLLAAVAGIYDAEDGKNYVNQICGGYIQ